jgi:competence protein ComEC
MKLRGAVLLFALLAGVVVLPAIGGAQARSGQGRGTQPANSKPLTIYVVDTEGGKATLFVTPAGESLLMDSGNPGGRDTDRIMAAIADAGLSRIDYLLTTHYHVDHVGGLQELAKRIPIGTFIDHGPTVEEREQVAGFQQAYAELYGKAKHLVVKPGDRVPIAGVDWRIVSSAGSVLKTPLPGGGKPNAACAAFTPKDITTDPENGQSVGSVVTLGQFRTIDLGDLLWNKEFELMCPNNPIGPIDLYLVSHHGTDASGSAVLVHGLQPRVAVMQNGTRKGAGTQTMPTMRTSPGLEDIWQLHWGYGAGVEQNSAGVFIANIDEPAVIAGVLTAPPRGGGPGRGGPGGGGPSGGGPAAGGAGSGGPGAGGPGAGGPGAGGPGAAAPGAGGPAAGGPGAGAPTTGAPVAGGPAAAQAGGPVTGGAPAQAGGPAGPQPGPGGPGGPGGGRGGGAAAAHTPAYWIKISAEQNGTFTVTNSRNNFSKTYTKR